jgi:hypothetical protein
MTGPGHYPGGDESLDLGGTSEFAATPPSWLRCVDTIHFTGTYPLNLAHVVSISRDKGSQRWRAIDVHRGYHVIASEDDAKVEALIGGQP